MSSPEIGNYLLSFGDRITVQKRGKSVRLLSPNGRHSFKDVPPPVLRVARGLKKGRWTVAELIQKAELTDLSRMFEVLEWVRRFGPWLSTTVRAPDGRDLVTLEPVSQSFVLQIGAPDPKTIYRLSRFALLRREGAELCLESPTTTGRVWIHDPRVLICIHAWTTGADLDQATQGSDLPPETIREAASLLVGHGFLSSSTREDSGEATQEDQDPALQSWDFHDLLFHSRSRLGRHVGAYGKTERFLGRSEPSPSVKAPGDGQRIPLPKPDLDAVAARDLSLLEVMETRRSRRGLRSALTVEQLGEFLFRTARSEPAEDGERSYPHDRRPYPSGGSCNELELYVVVRECVGLKAGLYHYRPDDHGLEKKRDFDPPVQALMGGAHGSLGPDGAQAPPQILLVFAARFRRVAWAYESMAYALILKHVGVLIQSMYLVATSMGLGACAVGGGDSDAFAAATGLDYLVEGSVGEFVLSGVDASGAA